MAIRNIQFAVDGETGARKDSLGKGVTWPKIVEAGLNFLEKNTIAEKPKEETEKEIENYYFRIEPEKDVLIREFDIVKDNQWMTFPFSEIPKGTMFRARDDGRTVILEGFKKFIKVGNVFVKHELHYVEVTPVK